MGDLYPVATAWPYEAAEGLLCLDGRMASSSVEGGGTSWVVGAS